MRIIQSSSIRARYWVLARMLWRVMCIKFIARSARSHAIDILAYARVGACVPSCICVYVGTSRQSAVGTDAYVTRPVSSLLWGTSADITYSFAAGRWHSSVLPPPAVATAPRCDLWEQSVKSISYILIGWVGIRNYSQVSTDFNLNRYFVSFISVIDSKLYYSLYLPSLNAKFCCLPISKFAITGY